MKIREISVSDLERMAAPYNPRAIDAHDLDALARSMREFGVVEPIVANERTGHVVGGHQRIKAARRADIAVLPVVIVDLDLSREKALNLALNRISGTWEENLLRDVLRSIEEDDLPLSGFTDEEIAKMIADEIAAPPEENPEITFSEVLGERQDYVVLAFRNEIDFTAACSLFGVESVHDRRHNGKPWSKGLGRVLDGAKAIERLRKEIARGAE